MTVTSVHRDPVARTLTIVATFDRPAALVWQVWADPRQLERWWGPPTYPATFVDHDLTAGGRVTYYMTGPGGEKLHAWWRIVSVDPPSSLRFEEGSADDSTPTDDAPTTFIEVRIIETPEETTMTITCLFAPVADGEQVPGPDTEKGMRLAVGQIDAVLGHR
ncbi:MAG TPA: SRPBCC domain-containing protein [Candidatus Dormibacteraeota bacterium]|nr:SRPBCC domain-containing protein [Candidatus Dormibacteraeota bacterium]